MNLDKARFNMIQQQVRPWDVLDQQVLDVMSKIPRENFVGDEYTGVAYADTKIPLANGGVMMEPKLAGRLAQELRLKLTDKVLEVGTGSGYLTTLLAGLSSHVYSVEHDDDTLDRARTKLAQQGIGNVTLNKANGIKGIREYAPYDAIALTGSVTSVEENLLQQLVDGGRLFAVVGELPIMEAMVYTRVGDGWHIESLFDTELPPLATNQVTVKEFTF